MNEATLTAQGLAYGFLSKAFFEPPAVDFINRLVADDLFADWPIDSQIEEFQIGLKLLRGFCAAWHPEDLRELAWDYNCLFVGPGPLLAPPWESVYLSDEHLVFEKQTIEVRRFYRQFGLQAPRLNVEPDDHIGLEFAFMVHTCSLALAALEHHQDDVFDCMLKAQRDFLEKHLLRWSPDCLWRVIRQAGSDYYRGVAYLALGCLAESAVMHGLPMRLAEAKP
jgi:putative dimethyl sulfoxide reductase chaperone